jgi:hypothetical protein
MPIVFALRPLCNTLAVRSHLAIKQMNADGTLGAAVDYDYSDIDMELWAQQFLRAVDRFTSVPYVSAANFPLQRSCMDDVLVAKKKLASASAQGLDMLFDIPLASQSANASSNAPSNATSTSGLEVARAVLGEYLVSSLEEGYNVRAVVQSDERVIVLKDSDLHSPSNTMLIGSERVVMPLRVWPETPQLLAQFATATHANAEKYADAMLWDYAVRYRYEGKISDQLRIAVTLGASAKTEPVIDHAALADEKENQEPSLLRSLAQYVSVAPELWSTLDHVLHYDQADTTAIDKERIENALRTFVALVEDVADQWMLHWSAGKSVVHRLSRDQSFPLDRYEFTQTLDARDDVERGRAFYASLHLKRTRDDGVVGWPLISVVSSDGSWLSIGLGVDTPNGRKYEMPSNIDAQGPIELVMQFQALPMSSCQCAIAQAQVVRNVNLRSGIATRPAFIREGAWVSFPDAMVPLLRSSEPIDMGDWDWNPERNPLKAVFSTLFGAETADRMISCDIKYEHALEAGMAVSPMPTEVRTALPVALMQPSVFADTTVKELIEAAKSWFDRVAPATRGGQWIITIVLFDSTSVHYPLLSLRLISNFHTT